MNNPEFPSSQPSNVSSVSESLLNKKVSKRDVTWISKAFPLRFSSWIYPAGLSKGLSKKWTKTAVFMLLWLRLTLWRVISSADFPLLGVIAGLSCWRMKHEFEISIFSKWFIDQPVTTCIGNFFFKSLQINSLNKGPPLMFCKAIILTKDPSDISLRDMFTVSKGYFLCPNKWKRVFGKVFSNLLLLKSKVYKLVKLYLFTAPKIC